MRKNLSLNKKDLLGLAVFIMISEFAGILGSFFTSPAIDGWYATLVRPSFSPPNWIFAPVWTTLFALMGVASFLVWRRRADNKKARTALKIFGVQLALNTLWSILFFGLQSPGMALAEIIVLWASIIATIIAFAKVSRPASWLLLPYIAWVSFAGYLNFSIWLLNK
jgi:tryptophan-rich sensory protein